jgi:hypothetical protein
MAATAQANDVRGDPRTIAAIGTEPESLRVRSAHAFRAGGEGHRVDRQAAPNGAIVGLLVITRGEALGHEWWIDAAFLDEVVAAGRTERLKSRFTHPDMSSDGLGKQLGRVDHLRRDGDQVYGDLHFLLAASRSPEGDLPDYVMALADEVPEDFGTSIVFRLDRGAMDRFRAQHTDAEGRFRSPDPANTKHLEHLRLAELQAVDVVDEPAANGGGLFSRTSAFVEQADQVAAFAFGLATEQPAAQLFGQIHPERVKRFVQGFLESHHLSVTQSVPGVPAVEPSEGDTNMELKELTLEQLTAGRPDLVETLSAQIAANRETSQASQDDAVAAARAAAVTEERARFAALTQAYPGREKFAVEQFAAGATVEQAQNAYRDLENAELRKQVAELSKRVGPAPVGFSGEPQGEKSHVELAAAYAAEHKCSMSKALSATAPGRK